VARMMGYWWPWLSWGWWPMRSAFGIRKGHSLAACRNRVSRAPAQSPCVFGDLHPTQRGPCPRIAAASATTTKSACCRAPSNRRWVCAHTGRSCDHRALPAFLRQDVAIHRVQCDPRVELGVGGVPAEGSHRLRPQARNALLTRDVATFGTRTMSRNSSGGRRVHHTHYPARVCIFRCGSARTSA
jgi:hypothetical protein